MIKGRLQHTIDDYRQRLRQHEAQAEAQLEQAYQHVLSAIDPTLNRLYDQMVEKMAGGAQIPLSWLMESQRLENIKKLIDSQMSGYGQFGLTTARQLQQIGLMLGQQGAMAMLNATIPAGVRFSFGIPSTKALAGIVGATQAGTPLSNLFRGFGAEAAQGVGRALLTGVANGDNPRAVAKSVQDALSISRARALTIARTEQLRAYRSAQLSTFQQNSDVLNGWVWTCALDARCCAACVAMNGTKHGLDEEMGSHPNCRCAMAPLSKGWDEVLGNLGIDTSNIPNTTIDVQSGSDWFNKQDEATQRAILGAKYDGWANGDFTLEDMVGKSSDPEWGDSIYEKSLKRLSKGRR